MLNQRHQIVIVAGSLNDSTERIINYLSPRGIIIKCRVSDLRITKVSSCARF